MTSYIGKLNRLYLPLEHELAGEKIKKELYYAVKEIGKEKIQKDIISCIQSSREYIDLLMNKSIDRLMATDQSLDYDRLIGTLSEALLHFMLTISTLPSERKIRLNSELVIDVVIPNLRILKTNPSKSIIVQFIKEGSEINNVSKLQFIQPNPENIWIVSYKPLSDAKYKTYSILPDSYSNIIIDIHKFLKQTGDKSLRFIPST
ncbi:MAG TPA: hypothetical protein VD710_04005 [Nitrososphaeraceae archaeon]|nr:hypothetical protein [Nitrososphaeraceae archaeon]